MDTRIKLKIVYVINKKTKKEMFNLTTHSTYFTYGYMVLGIRYRTIRIAREETCCRHMSYAFRLVARGFLKASSHRQDST